MGCSRNMGYWGVKSYENDDADDALDAGFDQVHGALYEELMDDRNPLSFEQVQKRLADGRTLAAAVSALEELVGAELDGDPDVLGRCCPRGPGRRGRTPCRAWRGDSREPEASWPSPGWSRKTSTGTKPPNED